MQSKASGNSDWVVLAHTYAAHMRRFWRTLRRKRNVVPRLRSVVMAARQQLPPPHPLADTTACWRLVRTP